ncbi:MAG: IS110 family transposase [Crocinitomicaceae bacterium]|jgi:transposase|nr:IS110 family transposase [Crocinitomicaceae bacterium]
MKLNKKFMKEIIKQCVGIDIAKADFVATFGVCDVDREIRFLKSKKFINNEEGFVEFSNWVNTLSVAEVSLILVLEVTGVYHEKCSHFLVDNGFDICIAFPKRSKDFMRTLKIKKVTDKIASQSLATMGLEKKLDLWKKPEKIYYDLKHLNREKEKIQDQITQLKNQLHAESAGIWPNKSSINRMNSTLKLLQKQRLQVLDEITQVVQKDKNLFDKLTRITTIPGVGLMTATTIIGETNGFNLIKNKRQLVSYVGYDVINQESGSSVLTKARISKRGNRRIRKALHMPALTSIRHNLHDKDMFLRIVSRTGIKMKAAVAIQRKILALIYTLWKSETVYDPEYEQKKRVAQGYPTSWIKSAQES